MTDVSLPRPMPRRLVGAILPAACFALIVLALRAYAIDGANSGLTRMISGWAIMAGEGKASAGEMVAAYPPLPFLLLYGLRAFTGMAMTDAVALLSAILATGLAALWLRALHRAGYSLAVAACLTFLVVANPLSLRVIALGPQTLLVALGFWIFARTSFSLRRFGDVDAMMLCSASLILMVVSGPFGVLVALLCSLGIAVAFPQDIAWRHRPAVLLALLFPLMLTAGGIIFVNWILLHDGFAFVPDDLRFGIALDQGGWAEAPRTLLLACLACPIALVAAVNPHTRGFPVILLVYILFGAAGFATVLALVEGPAQAIALALPIAALIAEKWSDGEHRLKIVTLLLGLGLLGGVLAANADRPLSPIAFERSLDRAQPRQERVATDAALARHIAGRRDVMFDAAVHPAVIAARGSARGLITRNETAFQVALLRREPAGSSVVVRQPDPSRTADAIARVLPDLYDRGAAGYELEYDSGGWRVWTRPAAGPTEHTP